MEKACKRCGIIKPLAEFHKDRQKTDGHAIWCKPCFIEKQGEYAKRPPKRKCAEGMHYCTDCKTEKPLQEFHNNAANFTGKADICKPCVFVRRQAFVRTPEHRAKDAAGQKKWREKNPDLAKDIKRRAVYGVPIGWYAQKFAEQGGVCAICMRPERKVGHDLSVDHCHDTNIVRGLLCSGCNVSIGHFDHSTYILNSAIQYLSKGSRES